MAALHPQTSGVLFSPNGTVSLVIADEDEIRLYCEPEPNSADWRWALAKVRELGNGDPPDEHNEGAVVVLTFRK